MALPPGPGVLELLLASIQLCFLLVDQLAASCTTSPSATRFSRGSSSPQCLPEPPIHPGSPTSVSPPFYARPRSIMRSYYEYSMNPTRSFNGPRLSSPATPYPCKEVGCVGDLMSRNESHADSARLSPSRTNVRLHSPPISQLGNSFC